MNITCPNCSTQYAVDDSFPAAGRRVRCAKCSEVWMAQAEPETAPESASAEDRPEVDAEAFDATEIRVEGNDVEFADPDDDADITNDIDFDAIDVDSDEEEGGENDAAAWAKALDDVNEQARRAAIVEDGEPVNAKPKRRIKIRGPKHMSPVRLAQAAVIGATLAGVFGAYTHKEELVARFPSLATLYETVGLDVNIRGLAFENLHFNNELEAGVPVLTVTGDIVNVAGVALEVPHIRLSLSTEHSAEIYSWTIEPDRHALGPDERFAFTARLAAPPKEARTVSVRFADTPDTRIGMLK